MEIYFCIYFIVIGLLFIISAISEQLSSKTLSNTEWQKKTASEVLKFCLSYYPTHKKKPQMKLVVGKSDISGGYCFNSNTIYLYVDNNKKKEELINTLIHEYFHYYLITSDRKYQIYQDQLHKYTYAKHPQELLCNTMGKVLTELYLKENLK